ncbi:UTP--glucose-1-phosphate uridylyltransferase, partial [Tanacetum coccineum]
VSVCFHGVVLMIGLFDSEIGLPTVAIEPVHEGSASIVKDRKLKDRKRWWNMGLKAIADGKIGCIAFILYCFPNGQAQKMFGNTWIEIAKVVPNRLDNAVKNWFSVLCKKRVKQASNKENNVVDMNTNKRETTNGILL